MLDVDRIESSEYDEYRVTVSHHILGSFSGVINNQIAISSNANISGDVIAAEAEGLLKGGATQLAKRSKFGYIGSVASNVIKNIVTTFRQYEGAAHTSFPVSFTYFPNQNGYKDLLEYGSKLTQIRISTGGTIRNHLYELKLDSTLDAIQRGIDGKSLVSALDISDKLLTVAIGTKFLATGLFCDNISYEYSDIKDSEGNWMYCNVSMSFSTFKVLTAEEFSAWHL